MYKVTISTLSSGVQVLVPDALNDRIGKVIPDADDVTGGNDFIQYKYRYVEGIEDALVATFKKAGATKVKSFGKKQIFVYFDENVKVTAGVFEDAEFQKGDRVIVNFGTTKEPEVYLATIIQVSKKNKKVRVEFDDGHREVYPIDNKGSGIIGYCNHKRKIKKEIPIDKVDDMLDQDLWFSASLRNVNKPGFTLKAFQGKTPKSAKGLSVPNKIVKSEQPKVSVFDDIVKELQRIFTPALGTPKSKIIEGKDKGTPTPKQVELTWGDGIYIGLSDTTKYDLGSIWIECPNKNPVTKALLTFGKEVSSRTANVAINAGRLKADDFEQILKKLKSIKPMPVKTEQQPEVDVSQIKKVAKERLVDVQLNLLSKSQKEMYKLIKSSALPELQRIWYATEDTDLAFDFGRFQICQSDLDDSWYLVEVVGTGAKAGHKYYEETKSMNKAIKQAEELAKRVTASLTDLEIERIFTDNKDAVEQEVQKLNLDDLPYSYQEVDSRLNPTELTAITAPRYIFSIYNTKLAKVVVKKNMVGYDVQRVQHFYCSKNPSLPSAFTEALFSYAISIGCSSTFYSQYSGSYEEMYQQLLEDYSEGLLQVQVTYL